MEPAAAVTLVLDELQDVSVSFNGTRLHEFVVSS